MGTITNGRFLHTMFRKLYAITTSVVVCQLHGSAMATKSFQTFFLNLQDSPFKDLYRYIHNAMCGYVLFLSVTILPFGKKTDSSYFFANVVNICDMTNVFCNICRVIPQSPYFLMMYWK